MSHHLLIDAIDEQPFLVLRQTCPGQPPRTLGCGPYPDRSQALDAYRWAQEILDAVFFSDLPWRRMPAPPQVLEGHIATLHPPRHPQAQRWSVVPTPRRTLWNLEDDELEEATIDRLHRALRRDQLSDEWLAFYRDLHTSPETFSIRAIAPDGSVWISPDPFPTRQDAQAQLTTIRRATQDWNRSDFQVAGWGFQSRVREDQPFTFVKVRRLDGRVFNVAIWDLDRWGFHWREPSDAQPGYLGLEPGQSIRWQVRYSPYRDRDQWTLTALC